MIQKGVDAAMRVVPSRRAANTSVPPCMGQVSWYVQGETSGSQTAYVESLGAWRISRW